MHTPGDMSGSNEASHAESVLSVPQSSWRCVGDSQPSVDNPIDDAIEAIAQPVAGHDEWVARGLSLWKARNVFLSLIILMCLIIFVDAPHLATHTQIRWRVPPEGEAPDQIHVCSNPKNMNGKESDMKRYDVRDSVKDKCFLFILYGTLMSRTRVYPCQHSNPKILKCKHFDMKR